MMGIQNVAETSDVAHSPLQDTLRSRFHLNEFRRGQQEIIQSVLSGRDVMAVLPTGGGKSLCYQFPAVLKNQLVIVISPLIALMKDQVSNLRRMGIPAGCLHSGQPESEKREVFQTISAGGGFVLYLSPERAQKEGFHQWVKERRIALFAVDEAHCVSQWGHDFRAEYSQLKILKTLRPDVPVLALTASATPLVLADVAKHLGLKHPSRHVHGFYRPNLYYQVEPCADDNEKLSQLEQALRQTPEGRILVYCGTRRVTEELSAELSKNFEGVGYYHAGMTASERTASQESYGRGETRILIATNAFGMGIDHPDVRLVVHYQMPGNIDSLYQEMGRAGRDGLESTCLMLYARKDKGLQSFFIQQSDAPAEIKSSRWNTLDAIVDYAEGGECRHAEILTYYKDSQRLERCGHCDVCLPGSSRRIKRPPPNVVVQAQVMVDKFRTKKKKKVSTDIFDGKLDLQAQQRFELLREWRKDKAKELDVPAFVVFSDRTLRHLSTVNPQSVAELEDIHGFGPAKIEKFGQEVLTWLGSRSD